MHISLTGLVALVGLLALSACEKAQLYNTVQVKPGSECEAGGTRFEWGQDKNNNKKLDADEILGSSLTCNARLVVKSEDITPGQNGCARGGVKVIYGYDNDGDKKIDVVQDEVIHCNEHDFLVRDDVIAVGSAQCPFGGVLLSFGNDKNGNSVLETNEVQNSRPICQQRVDGFSNLIKVATEAPGANCRSGGNKFQTGLDLNQNLILEANEINYETYVCNGDTSLINVETLAPGATCETGGITVHSGIDDNANRFLDTAEYDFSKSICNGRTSLMKVTTVQPGSMCVQGGIKVEGGFDRNANGTLDAVEVDSTNLVCNGVNGYTSLVKLTELPINLQASCQFGGTRLESGLDSNRDGILNANEVLHSQDICKVQVNQNQNLISFEVTRPEDNLCQYGGIVTKVGLDNNNDRILQASEVTNTSVNCNTVMIVDGKTSLTRSRVAGTEVCAFGGFYFDAGIDDNRDGTLASNEVDFTQLVCNGNNGYNSLSKYDAYTGAQCAAGGQKVTTGLDMNRNNVLDFNEIQNTSYICNGIQGQTGYSALVDLVNYTGAQCSTGSGVEVRTGLDLNRDNILQSTEIQNRKYVCNGSNGANAVFRSSEGTFTACNGGYGVKFESGVDTNANGILDNVEIINSNTVFVCDGLPGAPGIDGFDGANALVKATGGYYTDCAGEWGVLIEAGTDWNDNGTLQTSEVTSSSLICELAPIEP